MATADKFENITEDKFEDLTEEEINRNTIENICKPLKVRDNDLKEFKKLMLKDIEMGLCKTTQDNSGIKCLPTYVQELPTGCERGYFIGLNLNGTNVGITYVYLDPDEQFQMASELFEIPENLLNGLGRNLFDFIAECLSRFLHTHELATQTLDVGFTFSSPYKQVDLHKGLLINWTKGINCEDIIGLDMVSLLQEAIRRRGDIGIGFTVILNEATGTLMSCAYNNKNTKIGLIIGTEINACYLEKVKYVEMVKQKLTSPATMIINTEWGSFGSTDTLDFLFTTFDKQLDENSTNPGLQRFEKMVSGFYLGEIARLTLIACIEAGALFGGNVTDSLNRPNSFKTKYLSQIESEPRGTDVVIRQIFDIFGYKNASANDYENVRYICERVTKRSSSLVAAGLACLIDRIGDPYIVVAIDGNLYHMHPCYGERLKRKTRQLALPEHKFEIIASEDGAGRGAALVAAALAHKRKLQQKS